MRQRQVYAIAAVFVGAASPAGAQKVPAPGTAVSVLIQLNDVTVGHARQVKSASVPSQVADDGRQEAAPAARSRIDARSKYSSIELSGLDASATTAFTQWAHASSNGSTPALNVVLSLLDGSGKPIAQYQLGDAVLSRFSVGAMDAGGAQVATAEAVLAARSLKLTGNVAR